MIRKIDRIEEALHIERHEAVCDLCGGFIALTKRELGERAKGYAIIVDDQIVQIICEECQKNNSGMGLNKYSFLNELEAD